MWKKYDELTDAQHHTANILFSGDEARVKKSMPSSRISRVEYARVVDAVRRDYAYWIDEYGTLTCRQIARTVNWDAKTLY